MYPYDIVTYRESDWMEPFQMIRPELSQQYAGNLINWLNASGAAGVAFRDVGNLLSADYYDRDTVTREQVKAMNVATLKDADQKGLKIAIREGNDYALPYADLITDMNLTGNTYAILDAAVPFYQIALHGMKNYTGESLNLAGDYQTMLLESAEYGAGLSFSFMKHDTKVLQDSKYSCYASAGYDPWKQHALEIITRYQREMAGLNRQKIVDHEKITDKVAVTTYADGTQVYVNYGSDDYRRGGITVPARDYLVERGNAQ